MRSTAGRKAVVAGTRAKARGVGRGRAEHPLPCPKPSDPTSKERGGEVGQKRDTGDAATGCGARVAPGREWWGRQEGKESHLSHPTPTLHTDPTFSRGPSTPTTGKATGPHTRPGCTAFQTSFPPYLPIQCRMVGAEAHKPEWGGVGFCGEGVHEP